MLNQLSQHFLTIGDTAWNQLIATWPVTASHPYVDALPEFKEYEWKKQQFIGTYTPEQWYGGLPLSVTGGKADLYYWQEEKLSYEQCQMFKKNIIVQIGCVKEDHIHTLTFSSNQVEEFLPLFHHSDRQKIRIFSGLGLKMEQIMPVRPIEQKKDEANLHIEITRPSFEGMVVGVPDLTSTKIWTFSTEHKIYNFFSRRVDPLVTLSIPDAIKHTWMQHVREPAFDKDFLNPDYYVASKMDYSFWSYSAHVIQINSILKTLSPSSFLVVPGDGVGLVDSLWPGGLVAGDAAYSSGRVQKETFITTLVRGARANQHGVLILSYVTNLMTQAEVEVMNMWKGPVVWVDNSDFCPIKNALHIARGVFVRGLAINPVIIGESTSLPRHQLYSENLLRIENISYFGPKNHSIQYWERMRPFSQASAWYEGNPYPLVFDNLKEYGDFISRHGHRPHAYLNSTGTFIQSPIPVLIEEDTSFHSRIVYYTHVKNPHVSLIQRKTHWAQTQDMFLFTFPHGQSSFELPNGTAKTRYTVLPYTGPIKEMFSCRILSFWDEAVVVNTLRGTLTWKPRIPFHLILMKEYFATFAHSGWEEGMASLVIKHPQVLTQEDQDYINHLSKYVAGSYSRVPNPLYIPINWELAGGRHRINIPVDFKRFLGDMALDGMLVENDPARHVLSSHAEDLFIRWKKGEFNDKKHNY